MPQPQPQKQFGLQDIPMVEQNFMIKQELQKHQKFPSFCDGKQQNNTYQLPPSNRNISRNQYFPAINGSHIRDVAQMFPYGSMNLVQDFPNGLMYTQQVQDQDSRLLGIDPQRFDEISLLESSVDNMMYTFNQPTHLQDLSHDVANVLTVGTPTFDSDYNYSLLGNHFNVDSDQIPNCRDLAENSEIMIPLARNASFSQFNEIQEQALFPSLFPGKTTEYILPHRSASSDPLAQKILFNTEDTNWNASYGTGNTFEQSDDMNCLPSLQSGSWSALMQSAVAEASSSDNNGMQEEWSELSFQNTEISTDNELSGFVDGGKQQIGWADTSMQNHPTPSSEPTVLFNDIVENNTFLGFQSSNTIFSVEDSDSSFGHVQQFFKTFDKPSIDNVQHSLQENDPFPYSLGGLDYVSADLNSRRRIESKDSLLKTTVMPNLSIVNPDYITSQQFLVSHQLDKLENANISVKSYQNKSLSWNHLPLGNSPQLLPGPCGEAEDTYQKQWNDYRNGNFGYPSQNITRETEVLENVWSLTKCDSQTVACKNQRTSFQEGLSGPDKFLKEMEPLSSEKASDVRDLHITAPSRNRMVENVQQVSRSGSQTSLSQFSFTGVEDPWASTANWDDNPQNFGLRLALPSQLQTSSNNLFPSLSSLKMGNSTNSQTSASLYPKKMLSALSAIQSQNSIAGRKSMEVPFTFATPQDASVSVYVSNTIPNNKSFHTLESVPTNPPYSDFPRISNSFEILMGHPKEQGVTRASTTRNSEPFGSESYSLLQQTQFLKNSETAPSKRCHGKNPEMHSSTSHLQPELSCLHPARQEESVHITCMHGQTGSEILSNTNSMERDQTEDPQISLQKAPSWFEQYYSNLRSGHILPATAVPLLEPVSYSTIPEGRQTLMDARSKKRKISTSRLVPWNKVVEQRSLKLQNMSMAQLEWTLATKRLPDKVEVEGETIEQVQELHRSKKRLILTTQLMQQIFRPSKELMFPSGISSNYDSMVYLTAKLALSDACCLSIKSGSGDDDDAHEMKLNESPKRNNEVIFLKDVEEFEKRAKKLESDLLRMEKISITGNKVELKEQEKFVVVNRLARFHYRGATPQRYVVALPMPRALPDVAQCLSL